jgi:hypothetical protein
MTEELWQNSTNSHAMIQYLLDSGKASDRKLRLFAAACCRRIWHLLTDERSRRAVEVAESFADGLADQAERKTARVAALDATVYAKEATAAWAAQRTVARKAAESVRGTPSCSGHEGAPGAAADVVGWIACKGAERTAVAAERQTQAELLRDIFGSFPFREVVLDIAWNDGTVKRLATAAYENRSLPDGTLDNARLAVLADALEEVGCQDQEILGHLREPLLVHVRGCFVLDCLLGKE